MFSCLPIFYFHEWMIPQITCLMSYAYLLMHISKHICSKKNFKKLSYRMHNVYACTRLIELMCDCVWSVCIKNWRFVLWLQVAPLNFKVICIGLSNGWHLFVFCSFHMFRVQRSGHHCGRSQVVESQII